MIKNWPDIYSYIAHEASKSIELVFSHSRDHVEAFDVDELFPFLRKFIATAEVFDKFLEEFVSLVSVLKRLDEHPFESKDVLTALVHGNGLGLVLLKERLGVERVFDPLSKDIHDPAA